MRYYVFGFNQDKMVEYGINFNDAALLRWFLDFRETNKMDTVTIKDDINGTTTNYYWILYKKVIEDLPAIGINNTKTVARHFDKLVEKGILRKHVKLEGGTFTFFAINELAILSLLGDYSGTENGRGGLKSAGGVDSNRQTKIVLLEDNNNTCANSEDAVASSAVMHNSCSDEQFEEWYKAYPKHKAKGAARKAYNAALKKICKTNKVNTIDAASMLLVSLNKLLPTFSTDEKFIPLPASWLNAERWLDEVKSKPREFIKPVQYELSVYNYQSETYYTKLFNSLAERDAYIQENKLERTGEVSYIKW